MNIGWAVDQLRMGGKVRRKWWRAGVYLKLPDGPLSAVVDSYENERHTGGIAWRDADLFATDWIRAR